MGLSPNMKIAERFQINLFGFLAALVLRLLNSTLRWHRVGLEGENGRWSSGDPRIIIFWHSRQLFMPWLYHTCKVGSFSRPAVALVSRHHDGRILANGLAWLGVDSVAGSSSHGGREAMYELTKKLEAGCHIGISPDGPRGPFQKLKAGAVSVAQRTGAPIYPVAYSAQRRWTFKSWDKMILPKPFSKAVLMMGDAITVPAQLDEAEFERKMLEVENSLNEVTRRADCYEYGKKAA